MSIYRKISDIICNHYSDLLRFGGRIMYRHNYSAMNKRLSRPHTNDEHSKRSVEDQWVKHWSRLDKNPHRDSFRLFSRYIGPDINIVPEDISASIIQPILNPIATRPFYQDKNMFDKILGSGVCPKTLLRNIGGCLYNANYQPVALPPISLQRHAFNECERTQFDEWLKNLTGACRTIFIKPSVDTSSGQGVIGFERNKDGNYVEIGGSQTLDIPFFSNYYSKYPNFILQCGLTQLPYISQFNPTSINTLRLATYRSVIDNKTNVVAAVMRIGKSGASVDNSHAGGMTIGVGMDGRLGHFLIDQYGNKYEEFNGINFRNNNFTIPDFDKVIKFAESVGNSILHHRLIAQDICLQEDGTPMLVEFNIRAFSVWLFQFTLSPAFGNFSNEIIEYCAKNLKTIRKVMVEPF